ncbi:MAG: hypothetical protein M3Z29_05615 [Pseudomonadota bacterium]|nr:hypothetical protein [Pseudomonadota bacterium]
MHALKLLALAATLTCTAASAQTLALYRGAERITGTQETPYPPDPTPFAYHVPIVPGETFQAKVVYTDANGTATDLTGSQRLYFQPLGCLTATPGGLVSAPALGDPSADCQTGGMGRMFPVLWVYALDGAGNVLSANSYFFRVPTLVSSGRVAPPIVLPIDPPPPAN